MWLSDKDSNPPELEDRIDLTLLVSRKMYYYISLLLLNIEYQMRVQKCRCSYNPREKFRKKHSGFLTFGNKKCAATMKIE